MPPFRAIVPVEAAPLVVHLRELHPHGQSRWTFDAPPEARYGWRGPSHTRLLDTGPMFRLGSYTFNDHTYRQWPAKARILHRASPPTMPHQRARVNPLRITC